MRFLFFALALLPQASAAALKAFDCAHPRSENVVHASIATLKKKFKSATFSHCSSAAPAPACPAGELAGLDSRYPVAGMFAHYTAETKAFVIETMRAFHEANPEAVFNVVVSEADVPKLDAKELDQKWVNLVPIRAKADYAKWTRDIFRFVVHDGKTALYHLNYGDESKLDLKETTSCEIARQCGLPFVVPESVGAKDSLQGLGIDSGGNLGVLPGGSFYRGTLAKLTAVQERTTQVMKAAGARLLDLDSSFLYIGHADEMLSIVKTAKAAPCDFAVLVPSHERALRLLVNAPKEARLDGKTVSEFVKSPEYEALAEQKHRDRLKAVLRSNRRLVSDDLIRQSSCTAPVLIEVPTLFTPKGKSVLPNQVNLLELAPLKGEPAVLVARTDFEPFDGDLLDQLSKLGVKVHFIEDRAYAREGGDVHCATNEIRACSPTQKASSAAAK